jgi:hypothetical protein
MSVAASLRKRPASSVSWRACASITDDNQLMAAANGIFDGLLAAFANEENGHG